MCNIDIEMFLMNNMITGDQRISYASHYCNDWYAAKHKHFIYKVFTDVLNTMTISKMKSYTSNDWNDLTNILITLKYIVEREGCKEMERSSESTNLGSIENFTSFVEFVPGKYICNIILTILKYECETEYTFPDESSMWYFLFLLVKHSIFFDKNSIFYFDSIPVNASIEALLKLIYTSITNCGCLQKNYPNPTGCGTEEPSSDVSAIEKKNLDSAGIDTTIFSSDSDETTSNSSSSYKRDLIKTNSNKKYMMQRSRTLLCLFSILYCLRKSSSMGNDECNDGLPITYPESFLHHAQSTLFD